MLSPGAEPQGAGIRVALTSPGPLFWERGGNMKAEEFARWQRLYTLANRVEEGLQERCRKGKEEAHALVEAALDADYTLAKQEIEVAWLANQNGLTDLIGE